MAGSLSDVLMDNIMFIILLVLFIVAMGLFVLQQENRASFWEEYYTSEIAKVVNSAEPGDDFVLDIQKATEIAKENEIINNEIFEFDNVNNRFGVKLSKGKRRYYNFFNNVDVVSKGISLGDDGISNVLSFRIIEEQRG